MSDLISRQAAINRIESHIRTGDELYPLTDTDNILNHAFEIAASCVYNLPPAQPVAKDINVPCTDTISRQAAIDALIRAKEPINNGDGTSTITPLTDAVIRKVLNELPSVQERKGRWVFNQYDGNPRIGNWHCSECRQITIMPHHVCNYCPNCGAEMEGAEDEL